MTFFTLTEYIIFNSKTNIQAGKGGGIMQTVGTAEAAVQELEKYGDKQARLACLMTGEYFPSYLASVQHDCFEERKVSRPEYAKQVFNKMDREYYKGKAEFEECLQSCADSEINVGKYGSMHERWLMKNAAADCRILKERGELAKYLAKYNRFAETRIKILMEEYSKIAANCVPAKDSPEREPYLEKLRSLAEIAICKNTCEIREIVC